ncbi:MAG: hypothetical protein AAF355_03680 [Myxococcota bacterium]
MTSVATSKSVTPLLRRPRLSSQAGQRLDSAIHEVYLHQEETSTGFPWLTVDRICALDSSGEIDAALDMLFLLCDSLLHAERTDTLGLLLHWWPVERVDTDTTVGLMMIARTMSGTEAYGSLLTRLRTRLVGAVGADAADETMRHLG